MPNNDKKLQPCPFCGSLDVSIQDGSAWPKGRAYFVMCLDCCAEGPSTEIGSEELRDQAGEKWNARVAVAVPA